MELFNVPVISDNEPMSETAFYKFIEGNREDCNTFVGALMAYTEALFLDFEIGRDFIELGNIQNHKAIWSHSCWEYYCDIERKGKAILNKSKV